MVTAEKSYEREVMVEHAARGVWADGWAGVVDEERSVNLSGVNVCDVAPPTPPEAFAWAEALIGWLEKKNGIADLGAWAEEKGYDPEELGHYLGQEAVGAGATFSDDHPEFEGMLKFPFYCEFNVYRGDDGALYCFASPDAERLAAGCR